MIWRIPQQRGKHRKHKAGDLISVATSPAGGDVRLPAHMADMWPQMPAEVKERFYAAADLDVADRAKDADRDAPPTTVLQALAGPPTRPLPLS